MNLQLNSNKRILSVAEMKEAKQNVKEYKDSERTNTHTQHKKIE